MHISERRHGMLADILTEAEPTEADGESACGAAFRRLASAGKPWAPTNVSECVWALGAGRD
ncbi:hypothetical protein ACWDE9_28160 [Streptomyces olivaceoviridis]